MSRIDQALRLAAHDDPTDTTTSGGTTDAVFAPAWDVEANGHRPSVSGTEIPAAPLLVEETSPAIRGFSSAWRERLATGPDGDRALLEQFRRLAATLHQGQTANGLRSVMVTSAAPADGKTLTAVNLALVLSGSYRRRVLLVDADLRRPCIANVADATTALGLSEALKARTEQKLALLQLTPRLTLLPAGRPDPDPIGGLTSARMKRILQEAVARFDWVILDAPPIGGMADATLLAEMVDGALFVLRAGHTQHSIVKSAIESLGRDRIIGVVLNGCGRVETDYYDRYYTEGVPART